MQVERQRVGFLGPIGSYTHEAASQEFDSSDYKLVPFTLIEDVFGAVQAGSMTHGVVPFENSSNGTVAITLDALGNGKGLYGDNVVYGETYVLVKHCLAGRIPKDQQPPILDKTKRVIDDSPQVSGQVTPTQGAPQPAKPRAEPVCDLKHVKTLYSHPQAWGQCSTFLSAYTRRAERQDVSSTARAAEVVAEDTTGTSAAICSKKAAEQNGLDILAEGIEDSEGNKTRFFIIRRWQDVQSRTEDVSEMEKYKTLVAFTVSHGEPGALADSLAVFKKYSLNLTSINTRPTSKAPWEYIFFIEIMGRKHSDDEEAAVNTALAELGQVAMSYRWLGSWPSKFKAS